MGPLPRHLSHGAFSTWKGPVTVLETFGCCRLSTHAPVLKDTFASRPLAARGPGLREHGAGWGAVVPLPALCGSDCWRQLLLLPTQVREVLVTDGAFNLVPLTGHLSAQAQVMEESPGVGQPGRTPRTAPGGRAETQLRAWHPGRGSGPSQSRSAE